MPDQEALLDAVGQRLLEQLEKGATSDTILKLSEAWAWLKSPDQAHGQSAGNP